VPVPVLVPVLVFWASVSLSVSVLPFFALGAARAFPPPLFLLGEVPWGFPIVAS
jgi:hypothetical protein